MNWLEFGSNIVDSLAWPMVSLAVVFMLRRPLAQLIPQVTKLRFRDLEADFRALSISNQSLVFLDGVARRGQWTFYRKARAQERKLGQAFNILANDLIENAKDEFRNKLKEWLSSADSNLVWFAAEVIGYFKLGGFQEQLANAMPKDIHADWSPHQLNCRWAHARAGNMADLASMLVESRSERNQRWLLFVYEQMPLEEQDTIDMCIGVVNELLKRTDISEAVRVEASRTVEKLKGLVASTVSTGRKTPCSSEQM